MLKEIQIDIACHPEPCVRELKKRYIDISCTFDMTQSDRFLSLHYFSEFLYKVGNHEWLSLYLVVL